MTTPKLRDLKLGYEAAGHGIQSAIGFELAQNGIDHENGVGNRLKHHRVGIDMAKAEHYALGLLLIEKGVITGEEYVEWMRLGVNEELARYQDILREKYGLGKGINFR